MTLVDLARVIAKAAHDRQLDKGGQDYYGHPARVAARVKASGYGDEYVIVAYLHDVVEDTTLDLQDLADVGFPGVILAAVDAITQRKREHRDDYYTRVLANHIARVVKRYDVEDNNSDERMALLAPETQERLRAKYVHALNLLGSADE